MEENKQNNGGAHEVLETLRVRANELREKIEPLQREYGSILRAIDALAELEQPASKQPSVAHSLVRAAASRRLAAKAAGGPPMPPTIVGGTVTLLQEAGGPLKTAKIEEGLRRLGAVNGGKNVQATIYASLRRQRRPDNPTGFFVLRGPGKWDLAEREKGGKKGLAP